MSAGLYLHTHHDHTQRQPGWREVHHPNGRTIGYVQRVRVIGQSRPGYIPHDAKRQPLGAGYDDTMYRALENVAEQ